MLWLNDIVNVLCGFFFSPRPTEKGTKGPNYCQPNAVFELDVIEVCEAITILIQNKPNMYM